MKARHTSVEISYNGTNVTTKLAEYKTEVKYTDPASGEADSLDVIVQDRQRKWITGWLPETGDTLTATIKANEDGNTKSLPCGLFVLDDFEFSGWPVQGTLSGVSVPADSSFRSTERTKNWENVTIREIGKEIANRAGISLVWDVAGEPFAIQNIEQSSQTDCDFYMSLCETYGLAMKVYTRKIVVYDREAYKKKAPVPHLYGRCKTHHQGRRQRRQSLLLVGGVRYSRLRVLRLLCLQPRLRHLLRGDVRLHPRAPVLPYRLIRQNPAPTWGGIGQQSR